MTKSPDGVNSHVSLKLHFNESDELNLKSDIAGRLIEEETHFVHMWCDDE